MNKNLIFLSLYFFVLSSCQSTYQALTKEVPDKYIEVVQEGSLADVETSLKSSGVKYTCKEFYFGRGSAKNRRACYVKAPEESQFNVLGIRAKNAAEPIVTDAGNAILVVGKVFMQAYLQYVSDGFRADGSPPSNIVIDVNALQK